MVRSVKESAVEPLWSEIGGAKKEANGWAD